MDVLVKVRFIRVSHPDPKSSPHRMIYRILNDYGIKTPFGFMLLDNNVWDRIIHLNERIRAIIGRNAVYYVDLYMTREELLKLIKISVKDEEIDPTSTRGLLLKNLFEKLEL